MTCLTLNNTKGSCPAILYISSHTECLSGDIERVNTTVQSAPRYGQCPKCSKFTLLYEGTISKNIQSAINLSRQCIQFTPVKVHSNTSYIIFQNTIALLIASEYKVHLWSDVHSLYTFTDSSGIVQNQLKRRLSHLGQMRKF